MSLRQARCGPVGVFDRVEFRQGASYRSETELPTADRGEAIDCDVGVAVGRVPILALPDKSDHKRDFKQGDVARQGAAYLDPNLQASSSSRKGKYHEI